MGKSTILGINIDIISSPQKLLEYILKNDLDVSYITVNNVHTIIEATKSQKYKKVINESLFALPDGQPLVLLQKLKGCHDSHRIFGPSLMEKLIDIGRNIDLKHYFFGSSIKTISKMLENIETNYPNTKIAGTFSPPFREFTKTENNEFLRKMNDSKADIYWIGLGAPKQEIWISENYSKLKHGLMIGIGAGFDYLAGNIKHAPEWMKNLSLEWFYRLIQDPRRLWKRYLVTNTLFIVFVMLEMFGLKKFE